MSTLGRRVELFPPISEILDIRTAKQVDVTYRICKIMMNLIIRKTA